MAKINQNTFSFLLALLLCSTNAATPNDEKLVVFLFDGFSWDYLDHLDAEDVPAFTSIMNGGVRAEYVQPIFPSVSWPSWTTIVTGLTAERHGIIGNYMKDPSTGKEFNIGTSGEDDDNTNDPFWWQDHIPLWTSATQADIKTSLYLWSRCDVPFNGVLPEKCSYYNNVDVLDLSVFEDNLSQAAEDLSPEGGFDLAMVYYCNVDELGHNFGPYSNELYDEIRAVDALLQNFLDELEASGVRDQTNIVIVSDHGMKSDMGKVHTQITKYVDPDLIDVAVTFGTSMHFSLKDPSDLDLVMDGLSEWEICRSYRKEDIPEHMGYGGSRFVHDILVVCVDGFAVERDGDASEAFYPPGGEEGVPGHVSMQRVMGGDHGYDDTGPESSPYMRGIFMAQGPRFRADGAVLPWIRLVDEYQVFLELLGIEGEEHEGDWERVMDMFVQEEEEEEEEEDQDGASSMDNKVPLALLVYLVARRAT